VRTRSNSSPETKPSAADLITVSANYTPVYGALCAPSGTAAAHSAPPPDMELAETVTRPSAQNPTVESHRCCRSVRALDSPQARPRNSESA